MVSFVSLLALMAAGPLSYAIPALAGLDWHYPHEITATWTAGKVHHPQWTASGDTIGTSSDLILSPAGEGGESYTLRSGVPLADGRTTITVPSNALPGIYVCYFPNGGFTSPTVVVN